MSQWIPSDDEPAEDGVVEVRAVRDERGRDGVQVRLIDPRHAAAFRAFYEALPRHEALQVLDRAEDAVIFAPADDVPGNLRRFAVGAFDAIQTLGPHLTGLSEAEIGCVDGSVQLLPRYRATPGPEPLQALGRWLRGAPGAEALDEAADALADPDPEVRRGARSLMLGRPTRVAPSTVGEVKLTVAAPELQSRGQLDVAEARGAVIVPAARVRDLTPAQRSVAAGLAGLPSSALDGLAAAGLPLVIETYRRSGAARVRAQQLAAQTGLPIEAATGGSVVRLALAGSLLLSAVATGLGALVFALLGLSTTTVLGILLTLAMLAMGGWIGADWLSDQALLGKARQADREAREERDRRAEDPDLARAWTALSEARTALGGASELPTMAASDLRDVLKAAEHELEELTQAHQAASRGLKTSSADDVRQRLAALDRTDPAQQRRVAGLERTLTELSELEATVAHITSEAQALEAVLSEVSSSIARWESAPEADAMDALVRATQTARARRSAALT